MADKQETQGIPFDMATCKAMAEKMMAQMGAGCDCTEMMSRMMSQEEQGCCDWGEMMSQMKAMWDRTQGERD